MHLRCMGCAAGGPLSIWGYGPGLAWDVQSGQQSAPSSPCFCRALPLNPAQPLPTARCATRRRAASWRPCRTSRACRLSSTSHGRTPGRCASCAACWPLTPRTGPARRRRSQTPTLRVGGPGCSVAQWFMLNQLRAQTRGWDWRRSGDIPHSQLGMLPPSSHLREEVPRSNTLRGVVLTAPLPLPPPPPCAGLHCPSREPTAQPISKLAFEFDRRKLTMDDVRELIYREVLEYHPRALQVVGGWLVGWPAWRLAVGRVPWQCSGTRSRE